MFYCRMRYSKPLFPQQIQGLDYQTVKDILEWLERPITEIRNSVPAYESLAAQRVFEDSFSFDASDSPEANLPSWFDAFPVESFTEMDLIPSDGSLGRLFFVLSRSVSLLPRKHPLVPIVYE